MYSKAAQPSDKVEAVLDKKKTSIKGCEIKSAVKLGAGKTNSPGLSSLKLLPLMYHDSHFQADTLGFTSVFTQAFSNGAAPCFYTQAVFKQIIPCTKSIYHCIHIHQTTSVTITTCFNYVHPWIIISIMVMHALWKKIV